MWRQRDGRAHSGVSAYVAAQSLRTLHRAEALASDCLVPRFGDFAHIVGTQIVDIRLADACQLMPKQHKLTISVSAIP